MSPYAPLYRNPFDQAVTWLLVFGWILVGLQGARKTFRDASPSEAYFLAASRAFFSLCLAIAGMDVVGLVFLAWLKITSWFWFIWELLFLLSVVAVFWIVPAFAVVMFCWGLVGRERLNYSPRAHMTSVRNLFGVVADVALYFAVAVSMAHQKNIVGAG